MIRGVRFQPNKKVMYINLLVNKINVINNKII